MSAIDTFNTTRLYDIAHARAGDKGNTLTLSLFPYNPKDFDLLKKQCTAARVSEHLSEIVSGKITRYELPNLPALHFVCENALLGGVTTSTAIDPHGKTLSYALLAMEIDAEPLRDVLKNQP
ncbi:AtuA-related protein [Arsenicibacter rosenii]|uniref:AtuA-like ferredoxin-fold domain-containing protein n=1 Tax=Arsenicibacter rosenii TaxID=1750698 RepID=A0A1S2VAY7_9BACT|nr:hypothetical protein [Arsenicibacter rosenii]OIN55580.1 hypothetical protein BLX24_29350 [Arsenicibacter rosenii]